MSQLSEANKRFITKRLIPFILRENGRGFMMERWILTLKKGELFTEDDIRRRAPKCNTAACIGGSIALLKHLKSVYGTPGGSFTQAGAAIGLNRVQASEPIQRYVPRDYLSTGLMSSIGGMSPRILPSRRPRWRSRCSRRS